MFGAQSPPRSALFDDIAEMISACPMLFIVTSAFFRPHFARHDCTAKSPVELAVSTMVWPLIDCGFFTKPSAFAPVAMSALPTDSSLVRPIVSRL